MEDKIKELGLLLGKANKLFEEIQNTPTSDPAESPKPQLEKGKWYKIESGGGGAYGCNGDIGRIIDKPAAKPSFDDYSGACWPNTETGVYIQLANGKIWGLCIGYKLRPATPEEVNQALVKEAERRGFKEGVKFKAIDYDTNEIVAINKNFKFSYEHDHLYTSTDGRTMFRRIYNKGQWAEIIKEEALTFGGNPVTIDGNKITCKGVTGTYEQLKRIYDEFVNPTDLRFGTAKLEQYKRNGTVFGFDHANGLLGIEKIKIGCSWGTIEEIKAILTACENQTPKD